MKIYAKRALLAPTDLVSDVVVSVEADRIVGVEATGPEGSDYRVDLLTPGYANCHSHAFHRGLRGRVGGAGDFWAWREMMYAFADSLNPERYLELATLVFREMLLAGFTSVGEFHYLHHDRRGVNFADSNAMGLALVEAATQAGIRLGLIDVCYLHGGIDQGGYRPLEGVQRRFGDQSVDDYIDRTSRLAGGFTDSQTVRILSGLHSLRAVTIGEVEQVVAQNSGLPWHLHLMEQPQELVELVGYYGQRPLPLLEERGLLDHSANLVHLNQVDDDEVAALVRTEAVTCACPTTEEDLADGLSPAARLLAAGARVTIGSDQHAHIDPFLEASRIDAHERIRSLRRTSVSTSALWGTLAGHDSIGFSDAGRIEEGALADMVAIDLNELGVAGADPFEVVRFATRSAVSMVWVGGKIVAADIEEERRALGAELSATLARWERG